MGARWPSGGTVAEWGRGGRVGARWPSGLERWLALADGAGPVRIPLRTTSFRNFGNSVNPALPVSFG